jgi:pilus assembly protein CpaF
VTIPKRVFEQTLFGFFRPIRAFLDDDRVSEIMINGPFEIFIERGGQIERTDAQFESREELLAALRNVAQYVGRSFDPQRPILEARLPDGSRVEAVTPPAAPDGPMVAIRRFFRETLTIDRLLEFGSLTDDAADTLRALVGAKQNIVVAGGTASGKTSLLNVLSSFIRDEERIVVIEDSRELQLQQSHVVQLEAQPPDAKGRGQVTIRDLFRATLRMRPDRIIVGEIRGGESLDLVQAMTSGHGGCLTTVHATHALDTLNRLETMALMSDVALPLAALRSQVGSAIDFIVHTARLPDGFRCLTSITEVESYDYDRGFQFRELFERKYHRRDASGKMITELVPTGILPTCLDYLRGMGFDLPAAVYDAAAARGT